MDFDSNPYAETDEEREKRLLEEFRAAEQAARDRKAKEGIDATNAALAKSGSDWKVPGSEDAAAPARSEAVAKGMADTDRALEMTGSKYRLPDVEIEQGAPEANPYRETVGQREFNPKASTKQLRSELAEGQNDALDYVSEKGEIQGRGLERQADLAGDLAEQRKQGMAEAQARVDQSRQVREAMQREAYQRLDKISAMVDNPPDQSRGKVLQIIGAVMGASGKGGAIGAGLQMLGRSMAGDVQGWATEIDANRGALQSMFGAIESQEKGEEHELRMQKAYADLGFGVYEASLAQVQAEAKSEEARAVAGELRNGLRAKYAETQIEFNERQEALRAKAGAGSARSAADDKILQELAALPEEQRSEAAIAKGGRAVELWKKAQGTLTADATITKTRADALKTAADAAAPPGSANKTQGTELLPGYVDTVGLDPATRTDLRKNTMAMEDILNDLGRLRAIRKKNDGGTWNKNDEAEAQSIVTGLAPKMSQLSGAGAPSESEREDFTGSLTDPTGFYLFKEPTELYDRMAERLRSGMKARLRSNGVKPMEELNEAAQGGGNAFGFVPDKPKNDPNSESWKKGVADGR